MLGEISENKLNTMHVRPSQRHVRLALAYGLVLSILMLGAMLHLVGKSSRTVMPPLEAGYQANLASSDAGPSEPNMTADMEEATLTSPLEQDDPSKPRTLQVRVRSGDTLLGMLTDAGLERDEAMRVMQSVKALYNPKKMSIGQQLTLTFGQQAESIAEGVSAEEVSLSPCVLQHLRIATDPNREVVVERQKQGDGFKAYEETIPLEKYVTRISGRISGSLAATVRSLRMPENIMGDALKAFSYDVDFQRDIQPGDRVYAVYEKLYRRDGTFSHHGNLLYMALHLQGGNYEIYRYASKNGATDYYTPKGQHVRKEFLRTPIQVARISSGFGMRRHPILGYSKMHQGVDFAAPIGTPILASGNGVVEYVGWKGGYGQMVVLRHNGRYSTVYAHTSRFAAGLRKGQRVRQGQVLAYVGRTGSATGPHLHYEIRDYGKPINPMKVKFSSSVQLAGEDLRQFKRHVAQITELVSASNEPIHEVPMRTMRAYMS